MRRTILVGNAAWFATSPAAAAPKSRGCQVIGHLSNLSPAKGLLDVIALARRAQIRGVGLRFEIAGPFENTATERLFRERAVSLSNLVHHGALYGEAKERFLRRIDAFIFPTRYRNEAEPLVIHEALAAGCPVIAYDRGCISALVDEECGHLVPRGDNFLESAGMRLDHWVSQPEMHAAASRSALAKAQKLRDSALAEKAVFLSALAQP